MELDFVCIFAEVVAWRCSIKTDILKIFAKFIGKNLPISNLKRFFNLLEQGIPGDFSETGDIKLMIAVSFNYIQRKSFLD